MKIYNIRFGVYIFFFIPFHISTFQPFRKITEKKINWVQAFTNIKHTAKHSHAHRSLYNKVLIRVEKKEENKVMCFAKMKNVFNITEYNKNYWNEWFGIGECQILLKWKRWFFFAFIIMINSPFYVWLSRSFIENGT
jgi:hypothetical protein